MRYSYYFLTLLLFIFSCKNAQKLLDKGNYEKAFYTAISDFKKDGNNEKAKNIAIESYSQAIAQFDSSISSASSLKMSERFETQLTILNKAQRLTDAVKQAELNINNTKDYSEQIKATALQATEFRYNRGERLLARGSKENALKAYQNFVKAEKILPDYKDVGNKVTESYNAAVTKILVNTIDQRFGYYDNLNTSNINNDVMWQLNSIGSSRLNKFYASWNFSQSRDIDPDHGMDLYFYGLDISPFNSTRYNYTVSKTITETIDNKPVTSTVSATVYVTRILVNASVSMDCRIIDYRNNRNVFSNRYYKDYTFDRRTATYSGDSRALSPNDYILINEKYTQPSRQNIYDDLLRNVLNDFATDMRRLYN